MFRMWKSPILAALLAALLTIVVLGDTAPAGATHGEPETAVFTGCLSTGWVLSKVTTQTVSDGWCNDVPSGGGHARRVRWNGLGQPGVDGSTWHTGLGAPDAGLGADGDLYLDEGNGDVYKRESGSWGAISNLTGPGIRTDCAIDEIVQWDGSAWVCSTALADLEARLAALEALLANVTVDGDNLIVTGNLQVVNGTGTTDGDPNGLGNVVIGYDTDDGTDTKTGSHYLIVGDDHTYTVDSGIVAGVNHASTGSLASVVGGSGSSASGTGTFVAGGSGNTASGFLAAVVGGSNNVASGNYALAGGGLDNLASGPEAAAIAGMANDAAGLRTFMGGGQMNVANDSTAAVIGGVGNLASGLLSFVGGGRDNIAESYAAFVAGGSENHVSGREGFIGGGFGNQASGFRAVVVGGELLIAGPDATCAWVANIEIVPC